MAAQNRCTTSVTIRSENLAIDPYVHPATIDELLPKSRPSRRRIGQRALLNHGGRTAPELPRSAGSCDHRENPRFGLCDAAGAAQRLSGVGGVRLSMAFCDRSGASPRLKGCV
jgi:hypothetical protein